MERNQTSDIQDKVTIDTLNVCGINQLYKQNEIMEVVQQRNIDILRISEAILHTGNTDYTMTNSQTHGVFWATTEKDKNSGTGILIKKSWDKHITNKFEYKGRIVAITLQFKKCISIRIIQVYLPADRTESVMY